MTQAGEHNPYNPSPVYCISPPTCTLSLSLSGTQREKKKKSRFLPTNRPRSATSPPLRFWRCGRFASGAKEGSSIFVGASQNQSSSPKTGFSTPDTDIQPQRSWSGRTQPPPTTASAPEQHEDLAEDVTRTWRPSQTRDVRDAIIFRGAGLGVRGVLRVVVQARGTSMRPPLLLLVRSQEYVLH